MRGKTAKDRSITLTHEWKCQQEIEAEIPDKLRHDDRICVKILHRTSRRQDGVSSGVIADRRLVVQIIGEHGPI